MAQNKKINFENYLIFFLSLFFNAFLSSIFPLKLIYFAPFLTILFYKNSFLNILWLSVICGLITDSFSSSTFGIYSLNYLIASFFLYREKRFFNDSIINTSIFTSIYAAIFSLFNPLLFFIFDKKVILSIKWLITDIILMPIIDGIYAFLFFALPLYFIAYIKKVDFKKLWITYKKMIFQK